MNDSDHAVDDAGMDVTMMENVPEVMDADVPMAAAPSVALSGVAKMGLKRVDDNASTDPESDNITTVVEYEVTFSSSGVTDGGLVFGAAISIDEEGKGAAGSNGVNEASAYIGGADGTWKLQFGSNDSGLDLVPAVGLADADKISGMTKVLEPLYYTNGDKKVRFKLPPVNYDPTADSTESDLMIGVATLDPAKFDRAGNKLDGRDVFVSNGANPPVYTPSDYLQNALNLSHPISIIRQAEGGIQYSIRRADSQSPSDASDVEENDLVVTISETDSKPVLTPSRSKIALTGIIGSVSYRLTTGDGGHDSWSAGTQYDNGTIKIGLGMDSNDVIALGIGVTLVGNSVQATYISQDGEMYYAFMQVKYGPSGSSDRNRTKKETVNEMEAYGLSFARDIGVGSNIALTYSRLTDKGIQGTFVGTKQWELDFTHDLGGGASFYAGIEQASKSKFTNYNVNIADVVTYTPLVKKSKVTTLEAGITMKF